MADFTVADLSKYRMERAREDLVAGANALNSGDFRVCANRVYYAVFHASRAALILKGLDFKKHSAVIAHFRMEYIKTGVFGADLSKILGKAFEIRTEADYEDFFIISKEEVEKQLANANQFVHAIEEYLKTVY